MDYFCHMKVDTKECQVKRENGSVWRIILTWFHGNNKKSTEKKRTFHFCSSPTYIAYIEVSFKI